MARDTAKLNEPGWHDGMAQFLAFTIAGLNAREGASRGGSWPVRILHVMLNMADVGTDAPLPPAGQGLVCGGRHLRRLDHGYFTP